MEVLLGIGLAVGLVMLWTYFNQYTAGKIEEGGYWYIYRHDGLLGLDITIVGHAKTLEEHKRIVKEDMEIVRKAKAQRP